MSPKTSPVGALPKPKKVDLETLQSQQLNDSVDTVAGNKDADYAMPEHEDHLVHLRLVTKTNNPGTKSYDVTNNVQKISVTDYEQMEKSGSFKQFDKVELLHDPRSAARVKADAKGEVPTNAVNQVGPKKVLRSTQDAQNRYKELFNEDAPSDKSFSELKTLITDKEAEVLKGELTKAQARYKVLYQEEAPAERTLAELLEAITHKEGENELEDDKTGK